MNGYTEKLEDFGHIQLDTAKDLFTAWKYNGLPKDFEDDGVKVAFNSNSGYVFLTNSEYQVAMVEIDQKKNNDDPTRYNLYSFYTSPYEGREGSFEDLLDEYNDMHKEDKEWFEVVAKNNSRLNELRKDEKDEK